MPLLKKLYLIDRKGLFIKKFEKKFEIETIDYQFFTTEQENIFFVIYQMEDFIYYLFLKSLNSKNSIWLLPFDRNIILKLKKTHNISWIKYRTFNELVLKINEICRCKSSAKSGLI